MEVVFKGDASAIRFPGVFQYAQFGAHDWAYIGVRYWGKPAEMRPDCTYDWPDWGTPEVYPSLSKFISFFGDILTDEELAIIEANNPEERK